MRKESHQAASQGQTAYRRLFGDCAASGEEQSGVAEAGGIAPCSTFVPLAVLSRPCGFIKGSLLAQTA
jgi:hypothetical protein